MEGSNTNTNKKKVEAEGEGESSTKKLKVTMGVETLDCPICYGPLGPPIFQCSVGHCICLRCREKLDKKCPVCSIKTSFKRCFAMEHVVQEAKVACSNEKYGCAEGVIYYQKEEHKKACPNAPCFCTASGCGFAGPTKVLLDHFLIQHKCPSTILPDSGTVSLRLQAGLHVLRCTGTSYFFLLSMASEPLGHAISLICVQPNVMGPKFKCNMEYDCIMTSCCESINFHIRSSSLSDGQSTVYDLIIPKGKISDAQNGIMLKATILSVSCLRGKGSAPDIKVTSYVKTANTAAVVATAAADDDDDNGAAAASANNDDDGDYGADDDDGDYGADDNDDDDGDDSFSSLSLSSLSSSSASSSSSSSSAHRQGGGGRAQGRARGRGRGRGRRRGR